MPANSQICSGLFHSAARGAQQPNSLQIVTFTAARDIASNEELTFYYGSNLWFQDKDEKKTDYESCEHEHMDDETLILSSITL